MDRSTSLYPKYFRFRLTHAPQEADPEKSLCFLFRLYPTRGWPGSGPHQALVTVLAPGQHSPVAKQGALWVTES